MNFQRVTTGESEKSPATLPPSPQTTDVILMKRSAAVSECSRAHITNVSFLVDIEGHGAYVPFIWDAGPLNRRP